MKDNNFLGLGLFSKNRRQELGEKMDKATEENPATPAPKVSADVTNRLASVELEDMVKEASQKLELIDEAFKDNKIAKDVAYMIATSHEYKIPNQKAAIVLVNNYTWTKQQERLDKLQGINKPVIKSKVLDIAMKIKGKEVNPLMVVDKFQGITPQSKGCKILLDGHHRKEALEFLGVKEVPIYFGKYNGNSEINVKDIVKGE